MWWKGHPASQYDCVLTRLPNSSDYISHSISDVQARFIFDHILPSDLSHATILDVGSRLGVLLYYVRNSQFLLGNFSHVIALHGLQTESDL